MSNKIDPPEANHPLTGIRRTGVVQDVADAPATVNVFVGGDTTSLVPLPYLGPTPAVGDLVVCSFVAGDGVIVGSIPTAITRLPVYQTAQVLISGTSVVSAGNVNTAVTFTTGLFAATPTVLVTMTGAPANTGTLVPRAQGVNSTGFNLYVFNAGAATVTWTNLGVNWLAIL